MTKYDLLEAEKQRIRSLIVGGRYSRRSHADLQKELRDIVTQQLRLERRVRVPAGSASVRSINPKRQHTDG